MLSLSASLEKSKTRAHGVRLSSLRVHMKEKAPPTWPWNFGAIFTGMSSFAMDSQATNGLAKVYDAAGVNVTSIAAGLTDLLLVGVVDSIDARLLMAAMGGKYV